MAGLPLHSFSNGSAGDEKRPWAKEEKALI